MLVYHCADTSICFAQAQQGGAEPGLLHHADWIASLLHAKWSCSDWHNAARLGYDAAAASYPDWLLSQACTLTPGLLQFSHSFIKHNCCVETACNANAIVCVCVPQDFAKVLPMNVFEPGSTVASVTAEASKRWDIPSSCVVCAGTTGSCSLS